MPIDTREGSADFRFRHVHQRNEPQGTLVRQRCQKL